MHTTNAIIYFDVFQKSKRFQTQLRYKIQHKMRFIPISHIKQKFSEIVLPKPTRSLLSRQRRRPPRLGVRPEDTGTPLGLAVPPTHHSQQSCLGCVSSEGLCAHSPARLEHCTPVWDHGAGAPVASSRPGLWLDARWGVETTRRGAGCRASGARGRQWSGSGHPGSPGTRRGAELRCRRVETSNDTPRKKHRIRQC